VTVFHNLPVNESLYGFLNACFEVVADHGRVFFEFENKAFTERSESVKSFVESVAICNFVVDFFAENNDTNTVRFILRKNFGQGHCTNIRQFVVR
jgi:hypothetical protein